MSKHITISGIYRNGKKNTVGLYSPLNRETDNTNLKFSDKELIEKISKYFVNKVFKYFEVNIWLSGAISGNETDIKYRLNTIGDRDIKEAIKIINTL